MSKQRFLLMGKGLLALFLGCIITVALFTGCKQTPPESSPTTPPSEQTTPPPAPNASSSEDSKKAAQIKGKVFIATTTSAADSGLLAYILPEFTAETGWSTEVSVVSDSEALQMGRDGKADVLLLHSMSDEDKFIEDGYGVKRYDVMYNDYVIVGPKGGFIDHNNDIAETFRTIIDNGLGFVSQGDDSGTYKKELSIWSALGVKPESNALYLSIGQGTGITLRMTKELNIYTLSDRATWLTLEDKGELVVVCEGDPELYSPYCVIPVSASVNDSINIKGGQAFADWITSQTGQDLIGKFGVEEFGQPLFIPGA